MGEELAPGPGQPGRRAVQHVDRAGVECAAQVLERRPDGQVVEPVTVEVGVLAGRRRRLAGVGDPEGRR
jgi:hypothetical protein